MNQAYFCACSCHKKELNVFGLAQIYNKVRFLSTKNKYIEIIYMQTIETIQTVKPSEQP